MTADDKVTLINAEYNNKAPDFFPFISKQRITVLKGGFYKKQNSNYRGLGVVFDKQFNKQKVILLGYYFVDKDYVIIPENLEMTEGKNKLVDSYQKKGYEVIYKFPSLKPYEFAEYTEEYGLALERKNNYIRNK